MHNTKEGGRVGKFHVDENINLLDNDNSLLLNYTRHEVLNGLMNTIPPMGEKEEEEANLVK